MIQNSDNIPVFRTLFIHCASNGFLFFGGTFTYNKFLNILLGEKQMLKNSDILCKDILQYSLYY